ncbi:hypothetical protein [Amycolatopsis magusensis]|uniref:hypothetical protein n=1 Tax=Amycolatopsis magusensis TaxID=882444 RepID=UPI0024A81E1C|nr:hypothetical protein [Amycolatopsis magusensis]MDI5974814.1 hypothetical protein [Amycolatopsis magusensis]
MSEQPRRSSGAAFGFFAVILFGAGYFFSQQGSDATDHTPPPSTSRTPYTPPPKVVVPAVVDGWQSVAGGEGAYAYDVPARWTPKPGTVHGWEGEGQPKVVMSTSAFYGDGFCPADDDSRLGGAGVRPDTQTDPAVAAEQFATSVANRAYTWDGPPPQLRVGPPEAAEMSLGDGKTRPATIRLVDVTTSGGHPCLAKQAVVGVIAASSADTAKPGTVLLAVYADQTAPDFTTKDEIQRILRSYRAVPAAQRTTVPASPSNPR